jgi:hypothetical protein
MFSRRNDSGVILEFRVCIGHRPRLFIEGDLLKSLLETRMVPSPSCVNVCVKTSYKQ